MLEWKDTIFNILIFLDLHLVFLFQDVFTMYVPLANNNAINDFFKGIQVSVL